MVTSLAMSGRSRPSTERAVVDNRSASCSIRLTTVSAVSPFDPLAIANRVSAVFGTLWPEASDAVAGIRCRATASWPRRTRRR